LPKFQIRGTMIYLVTTQGYITLRQNQSALIFDIKPLSDTLGTLYIKLALDLSFMVSTP